MSSVPPPVLYPVKETGQLISVWDIVQIFRRYLWVIGSSTVLMVMFGVFYSSRLPPVYMATTSLELKQDDSKIISIDSLYSIGGDSSYLRTQYEIMKSRTVLEKVVRQLDLIARPEFNWTLRPEKEPLLNWRKWLGLPPEPEYIPTREALIFDATSVLQGMVTVSPVPDTQIAKISVNSTNKALSPLLANAIARAYIDTWLDSRLTASADNTQWLQGRLNDLGASLDQAEKNLQAYREKENLINLDSELALAKSELEALTHSLAQVKEALAQNRSIYREITSSGAKTVEEYSVLPSVLKDPLLRTLKEQESTSQRKVDELSKRYGPKHPDMIKAITELKSAERHIRLQTMKIVEGIEKQYEVTLANEKALSETLQATRERVQAISRKQYRLSELEREVKSKESLHNRFLTRIGENKATSDFKNTNARVIDSAYEPYYPVKPKKKLIIIMMGMAGLLLSTGIVFLLEMLNNTVRTVREIGEKLKLPVSGRLPYVKRKRKDTKLPQQLFCNKHQLYSEAIRTLRTQISLKHEKGVAVIAVTSAQAGEGRTATAASMAKAFGLLGKTLVIDGNLRQPGHTLNTLLKAENPESSLAAILQGAQEPVGVPTETQGVRLIPSGGSIDQAQELLAAPVFVDILRQLEKNYDTIIIDCPPLSGTSDAQHIICHCNTVLYVVEAGKVPAPELIDGGVDILKTGKQITGVVLNKATL